MGKQKLNSEVIGKIYDLVYLGFRYDFNFICSRIGVVPKTYRAWRREGEITETGICRELIQAIDDAESQRGDAIISAILPKPRYTRPKSIYQVVEADISTKVALLVFLGFDISLIAGYVRVAPKELKRWHGMGKQSENGVYREFYCKIEEAKAERIKAIRNTAIQHDDDDDNLLHEVIRTTGLITSAGNP